MKKITLLAAATTFALSSICVHADTLLAPSSHAKMDGENKIVALYGNSFTFYNNNINTRLRDLTQSLLPDHAKGYKYRGITISSGHLGWQIHNLAYQNTLQMGCRRPAGKLNRNDFKERKYPAKLRGLCNPNGRNGA